MENQSTYKNSREINDQKSEEDKKNENELNITSPLFPNIPKFELESSMENLSFSLNTSRRGSYFSCSNTDSVSLLGSSERSLLVPAYLARRGSSTIPGAANDPNILLLRPSSNPNSAKTHRSPSSVSTHSSILERILTPLHSFRSRECLLASLTSGKIHFPICDFIHL